MIAINTMRESEYVTNKMLDDMAKMDECDIKIEDHYSADRRIGEAFQKKSCDAFKDLMTYYCS